MGHPRKVVSLQSPPAYRSMRLSIPYRKNWNKSAKEVSGIDYDLSSRTSYVIGNGQCGEWELGDVFKGSLSRTVAVNTNKAPLSASSE